MRRSMRRRRMAAIVGLLLPVLFGVLQQAPAAQAQMSDMQRSATSKQEASQQEPVVTSTGLVLTPPPPLVSADGVQLAGSWRGPYTFRNLNSGKCLEIGNEATGDFAPANQWTCMAGWTQQMWWTWHDGGDGFVEYEHIANAHSRKCLDLQNFGRGALVVQFACYTVQNQSWWYTSEQPNKRVNAATYYCMEVAGGVISNGAKILQWDCHGRAHQIWLRYNV